MSSSAARPSPSRRSFRDRFEVSFGSERSAPELQRGLDLGGFTVSGKIDRIDRDPFGARGIVVDYKSGRTAHSAAEIERAQLLQIPLYMLVLRDLVGIEPLGGVYRALAGDGKARGLLRTELREDETSADRVGGELLSNGLPFERHFDGTGFLAHYQFTSPGKSYGIHPVYTGLQ